MTTEQDVQAQSKKVNYALVASFLSLIVSSLAASATIYNATQTHISAKSALASVRPMIVVDVASASETDGVLSVQFAIHNQGKTSAEIEDFEWVYSRDEKEYRYHSNPVTKRAIIHAGGTNAVTIKSKRFIDEDGKPVDLRKGFDERGRLLVYVTYRGREVDEPFTERLLVPVSWDEAKTP